MLPAFLSGAMLVARVGLRPGLGRRARVLCANSIRNRAHYGHAPASLARCAHVPAGIRVAVVVSRVEVHTGKTDRDVDALRRVEHDFEPARRLLMLSFLLLFVASTMCGSVVGRISEARSGKEEDYGKG